MNNMKYYGGLRWPLLLQMGSLLSTGLVGVLQVVLG